MKRFLTVIVIDLVLVLLQTSFLPELMGMRYNPNLVLAFSLALFALDRTGMALMSGLIGGLLIDLSSFSHVGVSSFVFVLLFLLLSYVSRSFFRSWIIKIFILGIFSFFYLGMINTDNFSNLYAVATVTAATLLSAFIFYFAGKELLDEARTF